MILKLAPLSLLEASVSTLTARYGKRENSVPTHTFRHAIFCYADTKEIFVAFPMFQKTVCVYCVCVYIYIYMAVK